MPCVASLLTSSPSPDVGNHPTIDPIPPERVENIPLWLPSSLPATLPAQLRTTGLAPGLLDKETRLRVGQADDALAKIRHQRRIVTGLVIFKKLNVSGAGQKKNTRMRTLFKRFNHRTERVAERYRASRKALEVLDPGGAWESRLKVLHAEDIHGPGKEEVDKHDRRPEASEKRREQSWIWLVPRVETAPDIGVMEEHLDANLRVEWAKSRARAARWTEEVALLPEEMRRTLAFFKWKAEWWRSQIGLRSDEPDHICSGVDAYAERQAVYLERLAIGFVKCWLPILQKHGVRPCWESEYAMHVDIQGGGPGSDTPKEDGMDVEDGGNVNLDEDDEDEGLDTDNEEDEDGIYDNYEIDT